MDLKTALEWLELMTLEGQDLITLKKKYRKLTLKYHPDKGGKTKDFVQLQAAYNYLQDCIKYPNSHKANSQTDQEPNNVQDIEFYKSKVDLLQKRNTQLQNHIDSEILLIKSFYRQLDQVNSNTNQYNSNLSKILDEELAKLDKKYKSGWWKSVIGIKSMDKNDLIMLQNNLIGEHNELLTKSQKENQKGVLDQYRLILDQIVQGINKF